MLRALHQTLAMSALLTGIVFSPALAQSLDELPPFVAKQAKQVINSCRAMGQDVRYEPLELVQLVQFGAATTNGGRESYVIDTSRVSCAGRPGSPGVRPWCPGNGCRLVVITPRGRSDFKIDLDVTVTGWMIIGYDAPFARIAVTAGGQTTEYTAGANGLQRAR